MAAFLRLFDLNGIATRKQAWQAVFLLLAVVAAMVVAAERVPALTRALFPVLGFVFALVICTLVRRLHDAGRSGLWVLATLIPGAGILAAMMIASLSPRRRYVDGHPVARAIGTLALGAVVVLACSRVFWAPYIIISGHMNPGLLAGDYIAVAYAGAGGMARGDAVVFRHPVTGQSMVSRIIGLPGDTVQLHAGQVVLNGQPVPQVAAGEFAQIFAPQGPLGLFPRCENGPVGAGGLCTASRFTEELPGGRRLDVINLDPQSFGDTTDMFTVPAGHFFLMGDNRDNSIDSRFSPAVGGLGFVPADQMIGRVSRVLLSSEGRWLLTPWTWRAGRYLVAVE